MRPPSSQFEKRKKELARRERQKQKAVRRSEREREKADKPSGPEEEDPDIAGIVHGPQPLPENE